MCCAARAFEHPALTDLRTGQSCAAPAPEVPEPRGVTTHPPSASPSRRVIRGLAGPDVWILAR